MRVGPPWRTRTPLRRRCTRRGGNGTWRGAAGRAPGGAEPWAGVEVANPAPPPDDDEEREAEEREPGLGGEDEEAPLRAAAAVPDSVGEQRDRRRAGGGSSGRGWGFSLSRKDVTKYGYKV